MSLGTEEASALPRRAPRPFDEFVAGAEGEADRGDQDEEPAPGAGAAKCGAGSRARGWWDEPLREMSEAVVMVACEAEELLHPEAEIAEGGATRA